MEPDKQADVTYKVSMQIKFDEAMHIHIHIHICKYIRSVSSESVTLIQE